MPRYVFTGDSPEDFPSLALGRTLEKGDEVELDVDPDHPRLVPVRTNEAKAAVKAAKKNPAPSTDEE